MTEPAVTEPTAPGGPEPDSAFCSWCGRPGADGDHGLCRLALPDVILLYAGGREVTLRELQALGMTAGINAIIVGNYLTTLGCDPGEDLLMLGDLRMPMRALSKAI